MDELLKLMNELSKFKDVEIEFCLRHLMQTGKIDFLRLNTAYVKQLEYIKKDNSNLISEANTCVLESLLNDTIKDNEDAKKSVQRRLYLLNKSGGFQMESLNKKYNYIEEEAEKLSWYWRNKNGK